MKDMTCENFINSGIYYRHTTATGSPNRDHQPIIIDLVDKTSGELVDREMYDLQIFIRSGIDLYDRTLFTQGRH